MSGLVFTFVIHVLFVLRNILKTSVTLFFSPLQCLPVSLSVQHTLVMSRAMGQIFSSPFVVLRERERDYSQLSSVHYHLLLLPHSHRLLKCLLSLLQNAYKRTTQYIPLFIYSFYFFFGVVTTDTFPSTPSVLSAFLRHSHNEYNTFPAHFLMEKGEA